MSKTFKVKDGHLITEKTGYAISKEQLRAILRKVKGAKTYTQDIYPGHDGCDTSVYAVKRNKDGTVTIGCMTFTKRDVAAARKWLRGGTKKAEAKGR